VLSSDRAEIHSEHPITMQTEKQVVSMLGLYCGLTSLDWYSH